MNPNKMILNLF